MNRPSVTDHVRSPRSYGAGRLAAPPYLPRRARYEWDTLQVEAGRASERFDRAMVARTPPATRRWLEHAIPTGTPLFGCVWLTMSGAIKLGTWRNFDAVQLLAPGRGYIWAATTSIFGLPVHGFDRYSHGSGEMDWRTVGRIPVNRARGEDVGRSAAGRLAGEIALLPTAFGAMAWSASPGHDDRATATMTTPDRPERAEIVVDCFGRLTGVHMSRWGNPDKLPWGRHPFGVSIENETRFDGIAVPSSFRAGWWMGGEREAAGEFFRAQITSAQFTTC